MSRKLLFFRRWRVVQSFLFYSFIFFLNKEPVCIQDPSKILDLFCFEFNEISTDPDIKFSKDMLFFVGMSTDRLGAKSRLLLGQLLKKGKHLGDSCGSWDGKQRLWEHIHYLAKRLWTPDHQWWANWCSFGTDLNSQTEPRIRTQSETLKLEIRHLRQEERSPQRSTHLYQALAFSAFYSTSTAAR